jgi:hypothetical protein
MEKEKGEGERRKEKGENVRRLASDGRASMNGSDCLGFVPRAFSL